MTPRKYCVDQAVAISGNAVRRLGWVLGSLVLAWAPLDADPTLVTEAHVFTSAPLPLIPPDPSPAGVSDTREVVSSIASLTDVNVGVRLVNPLAGGAMNGDYFVSLTHASGYSVLLNRVGSGWADPLGYADNGVTITLDDQAGRDVHEYRLHLGDGGWPAIPMDVSFGRPLTGTWQPDGRISVMGTGPEPTSRPARLEVLNGLPAGGSWTLFVADLSAGGTARLEQWSLQLTGRPGKTELAPQPPRWAGFLISSDGTRSFRFVGTPGHNYRAEISSDLIHWQKLPDQVADDSGGFGWVDLALPDGSARFLRFP